MDHVHLEAPFGIEADIRWFYGKAGTLEELNREPDTRDLISFKSARIELRIRLKQDPKIEAVATRLVLAVPSLPVLAELLEERSTSFEWVKGVMRSDRRIVTFDPAGNRVTFKKEWPPAPL